jgi:hypothetical protein
MLTSHKLGRLTYRMLLVLALLHRKEVALPLKIFDSIISVQSMRLKQGGQPWKDNKTLNGGTYCSQIHTLPQSKHIRLGLCWFRGDVQIGVRDGLACFEGERVLWGISISITCPCYKANVGSLHPCKKGQPRPAELPSDVQPHTTCS